MRRWYRAGRRSGSLVGSRGSLGASGDGDAHVIAFDDVSFTYPNGLCAIDNISCAVAANEIVAVIGPSGSGKSTLLRLAAALELPTTGTVRWNLRGADREQRDRHPCAMVFQEDTLLPWLRVWQNVTLSYRFKHVRGRTVRQRADELLRLVGLAEFSDYFPSRLSGGMKRRVALLAAIAPMPEILLLDEPFSALDEPTRIVIHSELHRLLRRFGVSALLVTHDLGEAITLADRVVLISQRPARVVREYVVPFQGERDMLQLRDQPEFLDLYGSIWHDLRAELQTEAARA